MRRFNRGRFIKMAGATLIIMLVVAGVVVYFFSPVDFSPANSNLMLVYVTKRGHIKGHTEYCEHSINDDKRIRLTFTPYAEPKGANDHQIDPNNWRDEPLAHHFLTNDVIVVPQIDYEVTQDGGATWKGFWQYANLDNNYPSCDAFGSLDIDNFWVWAGSSIAVTHDGGDTWLVHNGRLEWNGIDDMNIKMVNFDTPNTGRVVFVINAASQYKFNITLFTTDGGRTWRD